MLIIKYIILAIIQGFTEPLPISSSGHLMIFKCLFNNNVINDINFEIVVNIGSLIGIIFLYKKELSTVIRDFFMYIKTKNKKYKIFMVNCTRYHPTMYNRFIFKRFYRK